MGRLYLATASAVWLRSGLRPVRLSVCRAFLFESDALTDSSPRAKRPAPALVLPCMASKVLVAGPEMGLAESAKPMVTGPLDSMRVSESVKVALLRLLSCPRAAWANLLVLVEQLHFGQADTIVYHGDHHGVDHCNKNKNKWKEEKEKRTSLWDPTSEKSMP